MKWMLKAGHVLYEGLAKVVLVMGPRPYVHGKLRSHRKQYTTNCKPDTESNVGNAMNTQSQNRTTTGLASFVRPS
jgi:hypothetical protein